MTPVADRIGLFLGFNLLVGHSFVASFLILMGFGIGGMVLVGLIGESRMVPLSPRKQFIAFFPGVVILSIGMAALFQVAEHLPSGQRWYTAPAFHFFVIGAVALASALFAKGEYDAGTYPRRAILSPTKFFINGVLCTSFGYVIVTTATACLVGGAWRQAQGMALLCLACLGFFLVLVAADGTITKTPVSDKAPHAHREDWKFPWK